MQVREILKKVGHSLVLLSEITTSLLRNPFFAIWFLAGIVYIERHNKFMFCMSIAPVKWELETCEAIAKEVGNAESIQALSLLGLLVYFLAYIPQFFKGRSFKKGIAIALAYFILLSAFISGVTYLHIKRKEVYRKMIEERTYVPTQYDEEEL